MDYSIRTIARCVNFLYSPAIEEAIERRGQFSSIEFYKKLDKGRNCPFVEYSRIKGGENWILPRPMEAGFRLHMRTYLYL